jgi:DNA replication protein DnaC
MQHISDIAALQGSSSEQHQQPSDSRVDYYSTLLAELSVAKIKAYKQVHHLDDAKRLLVAIMRRQATDFQKTEQECTAWMEKNAKEINHALGWLIGIETVEFPTRKGLYIYGYTGLGKTALTDALIELDKALQLGRLGVLIDAYSSARHWLANPLDTPHPSKPVVVDDLGTDMPENWFGTVKDPMEGFIAERYRVWLNFGIITSFTSNLHWDNAPSISSRYKDPRTERRLREMATPLKLKK